MPGLVSTEPPFSAAHTTGWRAAAAGLRLYVSLVPRLHADANKHHSPLTRKLCRCLQQTRLVYSFPASSHASLQAVSITFACAIETGHMPAKEKKWQLQWACALSS